MKKPLLKGLKDLNKTLARVERKTYHRILATAVIQYSRMSGDRRLLGALRARDFRTLYRLADGLVSQTFETAALHFAAHQTAALIRKYPFRPEEIGEDPEANALRGFLAAEHRCKRQNQWHRAKARRSSRWEEYLFRMRSWIEFELNTEPDLQEIYDLCDFTGGANVGVHGDATNLARKLLARLSVTPSALPYFSASMTANQTYGLLYSRGNGAVSSVYVSEIDVSERAEIVDYNKIAFVPKTARIHRTVASEPLGNGYLQKGIDLLMRKVLLRAGINLSSQSLNQRLAREGSVDETEDGFCTIDLSSASDSISIGLVKDLLPPAWFRLLDRVRSPSYRLPSSQKSVRYEKFCSMGNGFCFPLETMIFAAACHACRCGKAGVDYMVYGDDIIVRRKYFSDVVALLKRLGFKTNVKKTFAEGPFRESCGSNWYRGEDVTPFTLDFKLDTLSSLFKFLNLARRNDASQRYLDETFRFVMSRIPDRYLFWRPYKGAPDTGIDPAGLDLSDRRSPFVSRNTYWQCPSWLEICVSPVKDSLKDCPPERVPDIVMAAALRGHPSNAPFTYRRRVETRVKLVSRSGDLKISFNPG